MGYRHSNPRLVKIHRNYTVEEIARLFGLHKNTVRNWLRQGLLTIDQHRPALILGEILINFLNERRRKTKHRCQPGQIYCVKCRVPREPAGEIAEYLSMTPTSGNLRGICPVCEILIHRRVNLYKLDEIKGRLEITFPQVSSRIGGPDEPTVNCDLEDGADTHDNA